jgi:hypothetical protein
MVDINYMAVAAAAAVSMIVGFLWYGPILGARWKAYMGFTDDSMKTMKLSPMQAMAGGALTSLLMAYVLAHSLVFASAFTGASGISAGLMAGFWNWLGFIVPVVAGVFLWDGKPFGLFVLNAAYYLVSLLLMGIILALWV